LPPRFVFELLRDPVAAACHRHLHARRLSGDDRQLSSALHGAVPDEALDLFGESLKQIDSRAHTSVALIVVGSLLALWSLTGAMSAFMTAIELAYERRDPRAFLRRRLVALELVGFFLLALVLVGGLLAFGPTLSAWIGRETDAQSLVSWIWWAAE
jgi:uncharacterized BrkB/YihY/UPF0761 family membrane protein